MPDLVRLRDRRGSRGPRSSNLHLSRSCDLHPHRVKVGVGECFSEDCLDPVLAMRSHEGVSDGDLVKPINGRRLIDGPLPCEVCEPPALPAKFNELRVSDLAPSLKQFTVLRGHRCPPHDGIGRIALRREQPEQLLISVKRFEEDAIRRYGGRRPSWARSRLDLARQRVEQLAAAGDPMVADLLRRQVPRRNQVVGLATRSVDDPGDLIAAPDQIGGRQFLSISHGTLLWLIGARPEIPIAAAGGGLLWWEMRIGRTNSSRIYQKGRPMPVGRLFAFRVAYGGL
jgi:hypothetical protein